MTDEELLILAERIATQAHAGATDKGGAPYIDHPLRVAERVREHGGSVHQQAAALLHDVLEDTPVSPEDLREAGVPDAVIGIVDALSRRADEDHLHAVRRAARHPDAALVKRCDVADNLDPDRLARLEPQQAQRLRTKYVAALAVLDGDGGTG